MTAARAAFAAAGFRTLLVDVHAHLYPDWDAAAWLAAAAWNLGRARRQLRLQEDAVAHPGDLPPGAVVLADTGRAPGFARLAAAVGRPGAVPGWTIASTAEAESLLATGPTGSVLLVAGRQVATRRGLEVLVLGTLEPPRDGRQLSGTLAALPRDAVAAVPWGFGKWWGDRGVALLASLRKGDPPWLADTATRPASAPAPRAMRRAAEARRLLAGTDPLPLRGHVGRVGRYGAVLRGDVDPTRPAASIRAILGHGGVAGRFGRRDALLPALLDQIRLRLHRPPPLAPAGEAA